MQPLSRLTPICTNRFRKGETSSDNSVNGVTEHDHSGCSFANRMHSNNEFLRNMYTTHLVLEFCTSVQLLLNKYDDMITDGLR